MPEIANKEQVAFFMKYGVPPKYTEKGIIQYPIIQEWQWLELICMKSSLGFNTKANNLPELKQRTIYSFMKPKAYENDHIRTMVRKLFKK